MKQALEALEQVKPLYDRHHAIVALRQAIEQAEKQEPVKMVAYNCLCGRIMKFESVNGIVAPQREWVGLTDEDKQIAFDDTQEGGGFWEFADAIEAKLKEKNT
jgi:hypothetical protein